VSERLVARVSWGEVSFFALLCAGGVALGIWFIVRPEDLVTRRYSSPAFICGVGWMLTVIFGLFLSAFIRQLFRTGPVLEIDERGILWHRWSDTTIPWNAITRVEVKTVREQKSLNLWLADPARYPGRSMLGGLSGLNKAMGSGDLSISMIGTDQSFDRLVEVVGAYHALEGQRVGTGSAPE
jgi:hypothetical protein